ncbi:hypothetical protein VCHA53O466_140142 [Vibrio chagasii]|nr:hypothetical protein VCHA53O466_140142 [Vibrio chagasii]
MLDQTRTKVVGTHTTRENLEKAVFLDKEGRKLSWSATAKKNGISTSLANSIVRNFKPSEKLNKEAMKLSAEKIKTNEHKEGRPFSTGKFDTRQELEDQLYLLTNGDMKTDREATSACGVGVEVIRTLNKTYKPSLNIRIESLVRREKVFKSQGKDTTDILDAIRTLKDML